MSGNKVLLHLYDLSNGLAAQLSLQLTGKYIPAVWHSSIVVFGEEVYYGQGILRCGPGQSHHGMPVKTVDLGTTHIDRDTFEEYLVSLSEVYTADKYHLLEFNCNNFTNDVTGFLTGGQIPQDVIDLPKEFLSTPFGASLRPTIDNMFRRSSAEGVPVGHGHSSTAPAAPLRNGSIADTLHQVVQSAQRAGPTSNGVANLNGIANGSSPQLASSLSIATNLASFRSILSSNKCVAVMFTGEWCGPCKIIKPVFEDLAKERQNSHQSPISFVLVDTTAGREIAQSHNISAVPTFKFFLNGKQQHEIKGADVGELKTQIQLLAMSGYPPHPHNKLKLHTLRAMSTSPVLYETKPNFEAALTKLASFCEAGEEETENAAAKAIPSLTTLLGSQGSTLNDSQILESFVNIDALLIALDPSKCFPLFDILKHVVLQPKVSIIAAEALSHDNNIVRNILEKGSSTADLGRSSTVTLVKLLCNCFSSDLLASRLLSDIKLRSQISSVLIQALLEEDASIRTAAGSLAYNVTTWLRKQRHNWLDDKQIDQIGYSEQEDFEIELCSALTEALEREQTLEVAHRLLASLGQLFLFSPHAETGLGPVAQALELGRIIISKRDILKQNTEAQKLLNEVKDLVEL